MESENKMEDLQDQITQSMIFNGILTAAPQIVGMYPQIESGIDALSKGIDTFLGDDKMVVITRRNGVSMAIVLNTKIEFKLSNEMKIEAKENAVIDKYKKDEWKEKLLSSTMLQTLKEKYERLIGAELLNNGMKDSLYVEE